jgi:hypothetical protein
MTRETMWALWAVLAVVAIAAIGVAVWRNNRRKQREHLAKRFGPEYERLLHEHGSATLAERELEARAKRVSKLSIKELSDNERRSFSQAWHQTQERFVDTPLIAVRSAHDLVQDVMRARGYPVEEFDQRVADLSVDHANVVEHYRAANKLHQSNQQGQANTEELRMAMVHYRALFSDLLGAPDREPGSRRMAPAHA